MRTEETGPKLQSSRVHASKEVTRHLGLDAIRGVAILLVIVHHVGLRFPRSVSDPVGRFLVSIGWAGVDLFFAISGFLITRILLKPSPSPGITGFFRKRFFRIVPLYLSALTLYGLASRVVGYESELLERLWIGALFLTGWAIPFLGQENVPYTITWSLSVEEFAYLLFGFVSLLGRRPFLITLLILVPGALMVRVAMVYGLSFPPEVLYYFPPGRIDAIALGGICAALGETRLGALRVHWSIPLVGTLGLVGLLSRTGRYDPEVATFGYSAIALSSAWLVSSVSRLKPVTSSRAVRAAAGVGLVSYFLYLFHVFVVAALGRVLARFHIVEANLYLLVVAVTSLTYVAALLSRRYFEEPLIRIGKRKWWTHDTVRAKFPNE